MLKHSRAVRRRLGVTAAAAMLLAPLTVTTSSAAADYPDGTTLRPAQIERGPRTHLLHTVGNVIVDGKTRVRVGPRKHMWLVGRSGRGYVVTTANKDYERWRLLRVTRGGQVTLLSAMGRDVSPDVQLSADGSHVALTAIGRAARTTRVTVINARTGHVLRARGFNGPVDVQDFGSRRMVLSEWTSRSQRTFWWNPHNNVQKRIANQPAYIVDISANRLGLFISEVPEYCQRVTRLSDPSTNLWSSCDDRVFSFSPNGRRMVTSYIESDGPGPGLVQIRGGHGRVLATYRSEWFGFMAWENRRTLLLETGGTKYTAAVRCAPPSGCERASRLFKNPGRYPFDPPAMNWAFPS